MDTPLISVIVPVYKVEQYVEQCVRSIMNQTYKNLEIILVDDGSPDKSGEICDKLALEDERITVFHKENGGQAEARNVGTNYAKGEYISFVDSDDYIAENYIEYLLRLISEHNADISCCNLIRVSTRDYTSYDTNDINVRVCNQYDALNYLYGATSVQLISPVCKLIAVDIVKNNSFPSGKKFEDEATTYKYFYNSRTTVISDSVLYAYYQNSDGTMVKSQAVPRKDLIEAKKSQIKLLKEINTSGEADMKQLIQQAYFELVTIMINDSIMFDGFFNNDIQELLVAGKNTGFMTNKTIGKAKLFLTFPKMYVAIKNRGI